MKLHFIAIGGAVMHNLAIALHLKGYQVTGSDDEIFEPSKSRLKKYGLLPDGTGWDPERISSDLDGVILGMHARKGNPELEKARDLGLPIYSFPEFLYSHARDKKRIVIGGSHGKTTITAMLMHIFREMGMDFDYLVGAQLEGFDVMVRLSESAPLMIFEGDEYLTSTLDPRPKFHLYKPNIALISGIAWDHINVFPTFENYLEQFRIFVDKIEDEGYLIYYQDDENLREIAGKAKASIRKIPYSIPDHRIEGGGISILAGQEEYKLRVFGDHNLANLQGALAVCDCLKISRNQALKAMESFKGAAKRLELKFSSEDTSFYIDFAHAPSKLLATVNALKKQFPDRRLLACIELHTYSSLNKTFLKNYRGTLDSADQPVVYYNPHALQLKKLPPVEPADIRKAFNNPNLLVFNDSAALKQYLVSQDWENANLLMMSSGNFDGMDLDKLGEAISG